MPSIKNATNLAELMNALAKELTSNNMSKKQVHLGLVRIGEMLASGLDITTPGQNPPNLEYYALNNSWHQSRHLLKKMNDHWDLLNPCIVVALFNSYMNGYLDGTASANPDLGFLDTCLDEMVAFTCPCGREEERPFTIIPSRDQAIAFGKAPRVAGLEKPRDIDELQDRFRENLYQQCSHPYALADRPHNPL